MYENIACVCLTCRAHFSGSDVVACERCGLNACPSCGLHTIEIATGVIYNVPNYDAAHVRSSVWRRAN